MTASSRPHVLVARQDNAGDVLLSGPAVRAVAAGAGRLTYLCGPRGEGAARLLPGVDEVMVEASAPWIDADPAPVEAGAVEALVRRLRDAAVDQAFVLTSFHQSPLPLALVLRLAGVGTIAAASVDYPGSLLDVRHLPDEDIHEVERSLSLVGRLGYRLPPGDDGRLRVTLPEPPPRVPGVPDGRYTVVHPGATAPARAWSAGAWAATVAALGETGRRVVVTGSAGEKALTAEVAGAGGAVDLGGRTSTAALAAVVAGAEVLVVGNTGPAHLAAAVGTPVVSLFAPVVPAVRWRPWMVPHRLLGDQGVACAGCRARTCPVPGHPCLGVVTPRDVVAAVEALTRSRALAEVGR
ncbi:MAG TPA: glycosyltransferase family 9 protein [Acidimicrobiales bacterium]|nr:glycosyltransferase family 9 protein [Acidimicrobiales bacterium]